ncbi:MAG: hypothetical protein KTR31_09690 [Myxococcales bacterium]|nr:hypothetical protein [Myxococcales bacterium]
MSPEEQQAILKVLREAPLSVEARRAVGRTPCRAFVRPVLRLVRSGWHQVDFDAWKAFDVGFSRQLVEAVVVQAKRFRHPTPALFFCAAWARHFDGGDSAWRQFALTVNHALSTPRPPGWMWSLDPALHVYFEHFSLEVEEAERVNGFLDQLDRAPPFQRLPRALASPPWM